MLGKLFYFAKRGFFVARKKNRCEKCKFPLRETILVDIRYLIRVSISRLNLCNVQYAHSSRRVLQCSSENVYVHKKYLTS